jgi:hypothetical protein
MCEADRIAQLLQRLVLALLNNNYTLPLICANCNEELLLLCPECEHYDGSSDGCPPAEEHTRCSDCERPREQSHKSSCSLGPLVYEAEQTIRDLEESDL